MTSSEMPTRIAMPQPFASGASATRATIESASGDNLNYVDGFPGKYSLPASEGGKYVSRGEMNAIGNMASNDLHYFKCGGLNTFDAAFCAAIGGYPKGAVLKYLYNGWLYDVISLKDGNTYDVAENGPDDINWAYLSVPDKTAQEQVFFEGATGISMGLNNLGIIQAKKTGSLLINSSIEPVYGSNVLNKSYESTYWFDRKIGASLVLLPLSSSSQSVSFPKTQWDSAHTIFTVDWSGWCAIGGDFSYLCSPTQVSSYYFALPPSINPVVEKGSYYALGFFCGIGREVETTETGAGRGYYVGINLFSSCTGTIKMTYA